ncbi:hypothetical protein [Mycolicibacter arupensis]|jgi:hypothetical protein|uniref:hypothetical protein n=1 Tax=Mycolicibacter arupensis TaxID=342002 RepID=UPI0023F00521|nr:hypothetical protein [Mycolicibacter arupensis]
MAASRASGADDPLAWVQPADVVCNGGGQLAGGAGDDDHGVPFVRPSGRAEFTSVRP